MTGKRVAVALAAALMASGLSVATAGLGTGGSEPAYKEAEPIGRSLGLRSLKAFALTPEGKLLVGGGGETTIKVLSPKGKLLATWRVGVFPEAIEADPSGTVFVGAAGKVLKLDKEGKVLRRAELEVAGAGAGRAVVTGIALSGKDVFVSHRALRGYAVTRFDRDLKGAKQIITGLRGCCGQMDICAREGVLYVAENARHRVVRYDRTGKVLSKWGQRSRTDPAGFGSCCNPMNICFGPDGALYTAEASLGRVKKYTPEGKFLGLVGSVNIAAGCVRVRVAVTKDGQRVYVLDTTRNVIRVLQKRRTPAAGVRRRQDTPAPGPRHVSIVARGPTGETPVPRGCARPRRPEQVGVPA